MVIPNATPQVQRPPPPPAQPRAGDVEQYRDRENFPTLYASMLPAIRMAARAVGYAILIHGSMVRDFDLLAFPWVEEAVSAEVLVKTIAAATGTMLVSNDPEANDVPKPHGRRCWKLYFGGAPYLDLSVAPRQFRYQMPVEYPDPPALIVPDSAESPLVSVRVDAQTGEVLSSNILTAEQAVQAIAQEAHKRPGLLL